MAKPAALALAMVLCCLPVADLHGDGDGTLASAASLVILQKAGPVVRVHVRPVAVGGESACRLPPAAGGRSGTSLHVFALESGCTLREYAVCTCSFSAEAAADTSVPMQMCRQQGFCRQETTQT